MASGDHEAEGDGMTSLFARQVELKGRIQPTDLQIEAGEMVALIGPNGGGKTSLLRALARIEQAGGEVFIDGENVDAAPPARRRRLLGFLPASREMTWPIAARDVIALDLAEADDDRVVELINQLELGALADRPVDRLSTGERARVLTARALAARPRLLLLDEPLSNLDPYWVLRFLDLFQASADSGQAVLVSLHDLGLLHRFPRALLVAEGEVQMDEAPAKLMQDERFKEIFRIRVAAGGGWAIS
jgi:iron complex transport system ATP-binding protein